MNKQIQDWIPMGTPLAEARQIMEQHHFVCTVTSYDSREAMPPGSDTSRWDTPIIVDGKPLVATNLTFLHCTWTDTNDSQPYQAQLTMVNGRSDGTLTVTSGLK